MCQLPCLLQVGPTIATNKPTYTLIPRQYSHLSNQAVSAKLAKAHTRSSMIQHTHLTSGYLKLYLYCTCICPTYNYVCAFTYLASLHTHSACPPCLPPADCFLPSLPCRLPTACLPSSACPPHYPVFYIAWWISSATWSATSTSHLKLYYKSTKQATWNYNKDIHNICMCVCMQCNYHHYYVFLTWDQHFSFWTLACLLTLFLV